MAPNNHIYLTQDKHYYSVPYTYIGTKVKVVYTRSMVHIYGKGEQIAVHERKDRLSPYSTVEEHLCSHHQHYLKRSPAYYIEKAKEKSEDFHRLVELVFKQNRYPEQLYRSCDGLLSLQRKTEPATFDKACRIAIEHQIYSYRFIQKMLENKMTEYEEGGPTQPALPIHQNIRGKNYYIQSTLKF